MTLGAIKFYLIVAVFAVRS